MAIADFSGEPRLGSARGGRYTGRMDEATRPGPEIATQAAGLPEISVVVPTFNERDNVTTLYKRLEAT
ncbi:hypothetical protein ABTO98_19000, partial [Acinetobacter baumannii]